jgi:hypothetical protein
VAKQKRVPAGVPQWSGRKAPVAGTAVAERRPRGLPGSDRHEETICWRFAVVDRGGAWGFDRLDGAGLADLMDKLKSFESMTMRELFAPGSEHGKDYPMPRVQTANKAAYRRLEDLDLQYHDLLSRLRLGGEKRLYGFRLNNVFYVLWWDPEHAVYPSRKRHT